tara:strand:+ start:5120 stop:5461 length:342 start_codon:yes stop_codon:yes gene_type:complete
MSEDKINQEVIGLEAKEATLIIECAPGGVALLPSGEMAKDDNGEFMYEPLDDKWRKLHPADVPDWVKQPSVIGDMREGTRINQSPSNGGLWFRCLVVVDELTNKALPSKKEMH